MDICNYCKQKGFNKEEYKRFKDNIITTATAIRSQLRYNGGMYYETNNIINYAADQDIRRFIIQELKKLDIEFINDTEYYRVVS